MGMGLFDNKKSEKKHYELINYKDLRRNDFNEMSCSDIEDLAESIRDYGLIHPIVCYEEGDAYTIVSGHRRYMAVCYLIDNGNTQFETIPCIIIGKYDYKEYFDEEMQNALIEHYGEAQAEDMLRRDYASEMTLSANNSRDMDQYGDNLIRVRKWSEIYDSKKEYARLTGVKCVLGRKAEFIAKKMNLSPRQVNYYIKNNAIVEEELAKMENELHHPEYESTTVVTSSQTNEAVEESVANEIQPEFTQVQTSAQEIIKRVSAEEKKKARAKKLGKNIDKLANELAALDFDELYQECPFEDVDALYGKARNLKTLLETVIIVNQTN